MNTLDGIDNAIAILGTYAALMAVLAVMVEAVISWLKIPGNSPIKGKPSPEEVLNEVKIWLKEDEEELQRGRIDALNKALVSVGETTNLLTMDSDVSDITKAASKASSRYFEHEQRRRGTIRLFAILLGILFAYIFQIDTLEILGDLLGQAQATDMSVDTSTLHIAGIILSGFAASTGSSFWHDQAAKLRGLKNTKDSVSELMSKDLVADTTIFEIEAHTGNDDIDTVADMIGKPDKL